MTEEIEEEIKEPDFSGLNSIDNETDITTINSISGALVDELRLYLKLEPNAKTVKFLFKNAKTDDNFENIFEVGVTREISNGTLSIYIHNNNKELNRYRAFILAREIFNLFAPEQVREFKSVQLVINRILLIKLYKHKFINDWRAFVRESLEQNFSPEGSNYLTEVDRLYGFFTIRGVVELFKPIKFFFHYIRKYSSLLSDSISEIHNIFYDEYHRMILPYLRTEEKVETIRCINFIFEKIKAYRAFLDYRKYFKEFKKEGVLVTDLTLNRFDANMKWIRDYSPVAPTYRFQFNAVNLLIIIYIIKFHPLLPKAILYKLMEKLPFSAGVAFYHEGYSIIALGSVIIPPLYLSDLKSFFNKLITLGYSYNLYYFLRDSVYRFTDLNFSLIENGFCVPKGKKYRNSYVIGHQILDESVLYQNKVSLIDSLMSERLKWNSLIGFGFSGQNERLQIIKEDILHEISSRRSMYADFNESLNAFNKQEDLQKKFLKLLDRDKKYGFFYIREKIQKQVRLVAIIEDCLKTYPNIKNLNQLENKLTVLHETQIEDQILLKESVVLTKVLQIFKYLFTSSRNRYKAKKMRLIEDGN
jgi:hypothetical protein